MIRDRLKKKKKSLILNNNMKRGKLKRIIRWKHLCSLLLPFHSQHHSKNTYKLCCPLILSTSSVLIVTITKAPMLQYPLVPSSAHHVQTSTNTLLAIADLTSSLYSWSIGMTTNWSLFHLNSEGTNPSLKSLRNTRSMDSLSMRSTGNQLLFITWRNIKLQLMESNSMSSLLLKIGMRPFKELKLKL